MLPLRGVNLLALVILFSLGHSLYSKHGSNGFIRRNLGPLGERDSETYNTSSLVNSTNNVTLPANQNGSMSIINFTFTQIRKPIESSSSKVPDSQPLTSTLYNVSFAVEAIGDADSVGHCGGDILSKGTGSRIFCQGLTWAWALLAATGRSNISDEYILRIEHAVRNGVSQTVLLHTAALSLSDHFSEFADTDAEDSGDGVPTWCQSAKRTLSNGDNLPSSKNGTNYCTALDGGPIKIPYIVTPIVQDWRGQIAEANGTRSGDPNADKYPFSSYGTG